MAEKSDLWELILFMIPILTLVAIWEIVYLLDLIKVLPSPLQALARLGSLAITQRDGVPLLLRHIGTSLYRICIGFSLAMLLGVPLGLLMGLNKYVNFFMKPVFSLLLPLPTLAWVPILLIIFGMGNVTIVIAIFLGGFFSITYNTATGVRGIDSDLIRAAQTMGANRWTMFTRIMLPGSMVSVIAGLRLAVGYSWRALVGAEMLAAAGEGVGSFIFMARQFSAVDDMFAGLTIIMVAGFIMERFLIEPLEKRTVRRWGMMK